MMVSEPRNSHYLSLSQGRYIDEPWRPEDDEILVSMRRGNRPATWSEIVGRLCDRHNEEIARHEDEDDDILSESDDDPVPPKKPKKGGKGGTGGIKAQQSKSENKQSDKNSGNFGTKKGGRERHRINQRKKRPR
jgi:hypothetical protein